MNLKLYILKFGKYFGFILRDMLFSFIDIYGILFIYILLKM